MIDKTEFAELHMVDEIRRLYVVLRDPFGRYERVPHASYGLFLQFLSILQEHMVH